MSSTKAEVTIDFVLVLLAREGCAWVEAASSSMSPLIRPGDQLRLGALDPARVRPGMIVAYRRDSALIVHRLLSVTRAGFVTKGDAHVEADAPVSARDLLAIVVAIRPPGGRVIDLERFPWPLIGGVLAGVAQLPGAHPVAWKARRIPFWLAAVLGR